MNLFKEDNTPTKFKLGAGAEKHTCPRCKIQFKSGDEAVACPSCQSLYHASCWDESQYCPSCGYSEKAFPTTKTAQQTYSITDKKRCINCGTELNDSQHFCPRCGQKIGGNSEINRTVANNPNPVVRETNTNKKVLPIIIGAILIAAIVLVITLIGNNKSDFNEMFREYADESWCTILSAGRYMTINTSAGISFSEDAYYALEKINSKLGFSSDLFYRMGHTTSMEGTLSESNKKYSVSWSYSRYTGLTVEYHINFSE